MLADILSPHRVFLDLESQPKPALLHSLAARLANLREIEDAEAIAQLLIKREQMITTGVKRGFAFPHAFTPQIESLALTVGAVRGGTDYQSLDGSLVEFIFMLLGPPQRQELHLRTLARLSRITAEAGMLDALREMSSPEAVVKLLTEADHRMALR